MLWWEERAVIAQHRQGAKRRVQERVHEMRKERQRVPAAELKALIASQWPVPMAAWILFTRWSVRAQCGSKHCTFWTGELFNSPFFHLHASHSASPKVTRHLAPTMPLSVAHAHCYSGNHPGFFLH